jgi:hypothetical protein
MTGAIHLPPADVARPEGCTRAGRVARSGTVSRFGGDEFVVLQAADQAMYRVKPTRRSPAAVTPLGRVAGDRRARELDLTRHSTGPRAFRPR